MPENLLNYLMDKSGAPTLVLVALALVWDRLKRLEAKVEDHATKLWDIHGEDHQ